MALISGAAERIYEIKPDEKEHDSFLLCTVYLVMDDKTALEETAQLED